MYFCVYLTTLAGLTIMSFFVFPWRLSDTFGSLADFSQPADPRKILEDSQKADCIIHHAGPGAVYFDHHLHVVRRSSIYVVLGMIVYWNSKLHFFSPALLRLWI